MGKDYHLLKNSSRAESTISSMKQKKRDSMV